MTKTRLLSLALLAILAATPPLGAAESASPAKPRAVVEHVLGEALARFARNERQLSQSAAYGRRIIRELALPHTDTRRMARFALGPYWDDATPAQRRRFTRAFTAHMVQTYGAALRQYAAEIAEFARTKKLEYRLVSAQDGRATVRALIPTDGAGSIAVDLLMHCYDGPWKVFDVRVAGISILLTYRASLIAQLFLSDLETVIRQWEEKTGIGAS